MKILLFANTDWFLYNFRLSFARFLRSQGHEVALVVPLGPFCEKLRQDGFRVLNVEMTRRSLNPLGEVAALRRLAALYRRERPDLVHHFTIKCVVYGTWAARLARVPAIVNAIEGLGFVFVNDAMKARLLRPVVKRMLRDACDRHNVTVLLLNRDDLATVEGTGVSRQAHLEVVRGSGIDTQQFRPGDRERSRGEVNVLFVGRLLYDKGIAEFCECARLARCELGNRVRFLVAGQPDDGNPASVAPDTLAQWKAAGDVTFLGHVSDMPALLADSDIVVLPSYGEGIPRSLVEAAACGKALVATDVRGCRDVVRDGENGLLVPMRDAEALARAVTRLVSDEPLRRGLGEAGRRDVLREWDERIVFRDTMNAYDELLQRISARAFGDASIEWRRVLARASHRS